MADRLIMHAMAEMAGAGPSANQVVSVVAVTCRTGMFLCRVYAAQQQ